MEDISNIEETEAVEAQKKNFRRLIAVGVSVAVGATITIAALIANGNQDDEEYFELEPTDDVPDLDVTTETTTEN